MAFHVVLTGSTGNVGTYLLSALVAHPQVAEIWCVNWSENARQRQMRLLLERGLPVDLPSHVSFFRADLCQTGLGLPEDTHKTLSAKATHIVHSAWPVDFNKNFASFEPSVRGVRNLIDFVAAATHEIRLFFISSTSAAGNWTAIPGSRLQVPEEEIDDWKIARFGYGQSKLVAERLLAEASRAQHISTAVCRVGQVAGPVDHGNRGSWPLQEWLPSLIASSKYLRAIPSSLGPLDDVDWIPVDRLAQMLVELLFCQQKPGTTLYHHVANPRILSWGQLISTAVNSLTSSSSASQFKVVDLPTWVDRLEASSASEHNDISQNPATKLLPFFRNLRDKAVHVPQARAAVLDMKHTSIRSRTLRHVEPVNKKWLALWMSQWDM